MCCGCCSRHAERCRPNPCMSLRRLYVTFGVFVEIYINLLFSSFYIPLWSMEIKFCIFFFTFQAPNIAPFAVRAYPPAPCNPVQPLLAPVRNHIHQHTRIFITLACCLGQHWEVQGPPAYSYHHHCSMESWYCRQRVLGSRFSIQFECLI